MPNPASGPLDPTISFYPGAVFFPDVNTTVKPVVPPTSGVFLYSKSGVLYTMNSSGVETPVAGGSGVNFTGTVITAITIANGSITAITGI